MGFRAVTTVTTRSRSDVIAVVLVAGMGVAGATVVVYVGSAALGESRQNADFSAAEQSMRSFGAQLNEVAREGGEATVNPPNIAGAEQSIDPSAGELTVEIRDASDPTQNDTTQHHPTARPGAFGCPRLTGSVQEFAFELALCAHLERERPDRLYARQLGGGIESRRVVDVVALSPGPKFDRRAAVTDETIPPLAVESDVGPGTARRPAVAFDCHPERARAVAERAVEVGFFERDRRDGHTVVRQATRYPDWVGSLVAVENKPDLDRPGDLRDQLRTDVSLGLFDAVVLCTATYVTGAHLNRLPEAVGVWRFDPESGEREVVREPAQLAVEEPGVELLDREAGRTRVAPVTAAEKRRARRRVAERAYGKGWRTYELPGCARCVPDDPDAPDPEAGLPRCTYHDGLVRPSTACGPECAGYDPAESPALDRAALRARRGPWRPDPEGVARRQAGLDRFGE